MLVRSSVSWVRAALSESLVGAMGVRGLGRRRALVMSRSDARMMSLLELWGIETVLGNHATVSQMRVARVSSIQMR